MGWQDDEEVSAPASPSWERDEPLQSPAVHSSTAAVAANAVPKGFADILNTPVTLGNLLMRGVESLTGAVGLDGFAKAGQFMREAGQLDRNIPQEVAERVGLIDPAIQPDGVGQRLIDTGVRALVGGAVTGGAGAIGAAGRTVANAAAKGAAISGASGTAGQAVNEVVKDVTGSEAAGQVAGAVTSLVTPFTLSGLPNKTFIGTPVQRKTFEEGRKLGLVAEPSSVRKSATGTVVESIAGSGPLRGAASLKNQAVTNQVAARSIGLHEDTPLTPEIIKAAREPFIKVYKEVSDLSPVAKAALKELQSVRAHSNDQWKHYHRSLMPEAKYKAMAFDRRARALEHSIDHEAKKLVAQYKMSQQPGPKSAPAVQHDSDGTTINMTLQDAKTAGDPDLLKRLRHARMMLAKTYDVEGALIEGSGDVSMRALADMKRHGRKLSGELDTVAKFTQAFSRDAQLGPSIPPPNVSGHNAIAAGLFATQGGMGPGALTAGLPLLRAPARALMLSELVQNHLLKMTPAQQSLVRGAMGANPQQ